jgi:hypothetical protein
MSGKKKTQLYVSVAYSYYKHAKNVNIALEHVMKCYPKVPEII